MEKGLRRQKMQELVKEYENGNETQSAFCNRHELNKSTFLYWLHKYKTKPISSSFLPLQLTGSARSIGTQIEFRLPSGIEIQIQNVSDVNWISRLVKSLN